MKMFKFLFALLRLQNFVVDDAGAGGGVGDIDIDDDDNDDVTPPATPPKTSTGESASTEDLLALQKKVKDLENNLTTKEIEETRKSIISGLKTTYPTFDEQKIKDYLVELHKKDPDKATALNTPIGWELIHNKEFEPKKGNNDYIDFGRNGGGVDRSQEVLEKLDKGGRATLQDKKALLGKFFR